MCEQLSAFCLSCCGIIIPLGRSPLDFTVIEALDGSEMLGRDEHPPDL